MISLICLFLSPLVLGSTLEPRQKLNSLNSDQINSYTPYTHYAAAAYCSTSATLAWRCGEHCRQNGAFKPFASGGLASTWTSWYVGYDPNLRSIIVAHQGENVNALVNLLQSSDIKLEPLDQELFPNVNPSAQAAQAFQHLHSLIATSILDAVQKAMKTYSTKQVTIVGHGLGGAIALIDGLYLLSNLQSKISLKINTYALPRVGNPDFETAISSGAAITHINNRKDPVPILPPRTDGYQQPEGEIHINSNDEWILCPGVENLADQCTEAYVKGVANGVQADNAGPYNGIYIQC